MVGECASDAFRGGGGWSTRVRNEEFVIENRFSFSTKRDRKSVAFSLFPFLFFLFFLIALTYRSTWRAGMPIAHPACENSFFSFFSSITLTLYEQQCTPLKHTPHTFYSAPVSSVCPRRIYMRRTILGVKAIPLAPFTAAACFEKDSDI